MKFELVWGGESEDLLVTTSGEARQEAFEAMVRAALDDPRFRPRMRILIDHRGTRLWALSNAELDERIARMRDVGDRMGPQRIALVGGSKMDYGRLKKFADSLAGHVPFELGIFESVEGARAWFREDAPPPRGSERLL